MAKNLKLIVVFLLLSLALNFFFAYKEVELVQWRAAVEKGFADFGINGNSVFDKELSNFVAANQPQKYFFISTWADFCKPCLQEMPLLDSLLEPGGNNITGYFITDITSPNNKYGQQQFKHFKFLYGQNALISAIHNQFGLRIKTYPVNLLLDGEHHVLFFKAGNVELAKDSGLVRFIHELR